MKKPTGYLLFLLLFTLMAGCGGGGGGTVVTTPMQKVVLKISVSAASTLAVPINALKVGISLPAGVVPQLVSGSNAVNSSSLLIGTDVVSAIGGSYSLSATYLSASHTVVVSVLDTTLTQKGFGTGEVAEMSVLVPAKSTVSITDFHIVDTEADGYDNSTNSTVNLTPLLSGHISD